MSAIAHSPVRSFALIYWLFGATMTTELAGTQLRRWFTATPRSS